MIQLISIRNNFLENNNTVINIILAFEHASNTILNAEKE